jgi:hypothetical protein
LGGGNEPPFERLSLADVRLKILIEMETDLKAQLLELRKRVRQAELARARRPASVVIAAVA